MNIATKIFKSFRGRQKLILPLLLIVIIPFNSLNSAAKDRNKEVHDIPTINARTVFEKLQCSAFEILPPSVRLDMLDYWDVDSTYKALNAMQGLSWIESMSDNYAKIVLTPVSSLEIKILPAKKGEIVMTVYTVGDDTQAQDSQLNFYDPQLLPLDSKDYFETPKLKDFFEIPKGSATSMKEIEGMIPFPTIAYSASPDNDDLIARLTVEQYINQDDWNIAKLFVKPDIILKWEKDKFKFKK